MELDTTDNDILLLNSDTVTTPGFLEELSAVLHLSPLHGVVCPRSNNAVIASFPYKLRDPSIGCEFARASEVHAALSGTIRRYSVSPMVVGFCMLVRRELITQHGLFDEVFAPGYCEEYDFCLRMNELGYSSIIANRAIVFHAGACSFAEASRRALLSAHDRLLLRRYPFLMEAVEAYLFLDRDPVDAFADALVPADKVRRVLVDIDAMPAAGLPDETSALLAALEEASDPARLVASLSTPDDQRDNIAAQYPALRVIRQSRLDGLWDVAVASGDMVSRTQLIRLNRVSVRWVFTITGIGAVRTWRTRAANSSIKALLQDAIGHADGVIALRSGLAAELESYAGSAICVFLLVVLSNSPVPAPTESSRRSSSGTDGRPSTSNACAHDGTTSLGFARTRATPKASRSSVASFDGPSMQPPVRSATRRTGCASSAGSTVRTGNMRTVDGVCS
jgi:hypothetical protein